jgi:uncharacterized protein (DUF1330 family)
MGLAKVAAPLPTRVNTMASYIVATVRITDPERFAAYGKAVAGLAERFGGEALLKGAVSEVLEGAGAVGERVVVSRFETAEQARAYIESSEYRDAQKLREGAAEVVMRLINQ